MDASFTLPLSEKLVENPVKAHAERVRFSLIGRYSYHLQSCLSPLPDVIETATSHEWDVSVGIFISSTLQELQLSRGGIEMAQTWGSSPNGAECRAQSITHSGGKSYHTGPLDIITYLADTLSGSTGVYPWYSAEAPNLLRPSVKLYQEDLFYDTKLSEA